MRKFQVIAEELCCAFDVATGEADIGKLNRAHEYNPLDAFGLRDGILMDPSDLTTSVRRLAHAAPVVSIENAIMSCDHCLM
jgi:hypothetical protein